MWLDTSLLALIERVEFIVIAQTAAIGELLTLLRLVVVEVSVGSSVTPAH